MHVSVQNCSQTLVFVLVTQTLGLCACVSDTLVFMRRNTWVFVLVSVNIGFCVSVNIGFCASVQHCCQTLVFVLVTQTLGFCACVSERGCRCEVAHQGTE